MKLPYILYFADTETTHLDWKLGEIIEISLLRLNDESQRTFYIKPEKPENISPDALRINGHNLDDLLHKTAHGRDTYYPLNKVLPNIENFFLQDGGDSSDRLLIGQNINFDLNFMKDLWVKENCAENFPFGERPKQLDTIQLQILIDLMTETRSEYLNLSALVEKYKVKKEKSHRSDSDTRMTKEVFLKQVEFIKSIK